MNNGKSYIRTDEHGVMRVGKTRVMLDSVVAGFQQGHSAETIQQQYPALSLEEVYGAIAFYLANENAVQDYLRQQNAVWEQWRDRANQQVNPALQRLRTLKNTDGASEQ